MIYCSTGKMERLFIHEIDDMNTSHYIDLIMATDTPTFAVTCCCDEDWIYEFVYSASDYERVKYNIMEAIFNCDTMEELLDELTEIFEDGFSDILVDFEPDDDFECDGDCEDCIFS